MKYTPIPSMEINRCSLIVPKLSVFQRTARAISLVVLVLSIICGAFYINVKYEERIIKQAEITAQEHNVVLKTVQEIIVRVGKVPVPLAKQYATWVFDAASKYAVDPILMLSVMAVESKFDYKAVSPTGPIGLFQVASTYHKDKASPEQLFDPKINIRVGAQILKEYSETSKSQHEMLAKYSGSSDKSYGEKVFKIKHMFESEISKALLQRS